MCVKWDTLHEVERLSETSCKPAYMREGGAGALWAKACGLACEKRQRFCTLTQYPLPSVAR